MLSRSFSWRSRAISEAGLAGVGVACAVGRHAAAAGFCGTCQPSAAAPSPEDRAPRPQTRSSARSTLPTRPLPLVLFGKRPRLTFHSTPPGSTSLLQVSTHSGEVHQGRDEDGGSRAGHLRMPKMTLSSGLFCMDIPARWSAHRWRARYCKDQVCRPQITIDRAGPSAASLGMCII